MSVDLARLEQLMAWMQALGIRELDMTEQGTRIHLCRDAAAPSPSVPVPVTLAKSPSVAKNASQTIVAGMHGQFYTAPEPDAPPFVQPGEEVEAGQPLYVLEVMKTITRIEAEYSCTVLDILCKNGETVAPGTPLFTVEPLNV
ncbi:acetyl-CoA carboxylase biotin carboxyl carrier protein subunit [Komagataeibacter xylinus]|uniref:Biotin carboxyl carrier protein of acetyl-CoA carboxylase n=2 Tax=Komagataeibacter TaxID=1434011 RepID=A0A850P6X6_9PROT|nr:MULTISPECIES: biotin/lipoyl-containing protein [Komagataeibacter]AZV40521.1 acetyl-CoA carboxylase biotin carboxyl carrier protein subunit [Komagataeibacter xylinus]NVN38340.1 acetyl-CoA carboxylase biotin carboxyl carrier protein subunit [Komagataeibacter swingsii]PYD55647.1 acetyl-CoA carboxylase biotin carboxyl carrier protein subunit [Komagataeibacter xylinus]GBQ68560.1 biotin carboxyl carrier protein of acetyl-CoA carboxylase [Komagataeibacter xylinus NBRC 15237]